MIVFWLLTPIMMLKFQIFLIPNFNFWGVPSSFQGIVAVLGHLDASSLKYLIKHDEVTKGADQANTHTLENKMAALA